MPIVRESFTKDEAEGMLGKSVISRVSFGSVIRAGTSGSVIGTYPRADGGYGVTVEWRLSGRQGRDAFSREEFEEYLIVDHLTTTQQRLAMYARYDATIHKAIRAIHEDAVVEDVKAILETAIYTDDCPVCVHPWGYCICREDR